MKAPHQWTNTWLKEDLTENDSVDCFMACYRSPSWTEYIWHKSKTKNKKKGKNAELEKTDVPIRPDSKSTKKNYLKLTKVNISNTFWKDL